MRLPGELIDKMHIGWNLGNSFDCFWLNELLTGGETGWGNPPATRKMIDEIAERGFNVLRIPVTWFEYVKDEENYRIDPKRLTRIKEVIDWAIDNEMFVIVNMHHENSWMFNQQDSLSVISKKYEAIWQQIAEAFKDYPDQLLFEALNEPRIEGAENEWQGESADVRKKVNELQKLFVRTIRISGANNAQRTLLITTVGASVHADAIAGLEIPDDPYVAVSLHLYLPENFCVSSSNGMDIREWSDTFKEVFDTVFERIRRNVMEKGHSVIFTEFGAIHKMNEAEVVKWADVFLKLAEEYQIRAIWWDNNERDADGDNFAIFDRSSCTWVRPLLTARLTK